MPSNINTPVPPSPNALLARDQMFLPRLMHSLKAANKLQANLRTWSAPRAPEELFPRRPGIAAGAGSLGEQARLRAQRPTDARPGARLERRRGGRGSTGARLRSRSLTSRIPRLPAGRRAPAPGRTPRRCAALSPRASAVRGPSGRGCAAARARGARGSRMPSFPGTLINKPAPENLLESRVWGARNARELTSNQGQATWAHAHAP